MEMTANNPERANYSVIYISPHLDDAILSCGGTIHQLTNSGKPVLIVTVMAGNPPAGDLSTFAQSLHKRWRIAAEEVAIRRKEDIDACLELGADWLHWEIPDCIYRRSTENDEQIYASEESLFGEIDPTETTLLDSLSGLMESMPRSDSLFVPLAVGHHVDHQLTRRAAEDRLDGTEIAYYEEYPYSGSEHRLTAAIDAADQWSSEIIRLKSEDIEARIRAIACYQSQISTFFADANDLSRKVRQYVSEVGGERFWRKSP
jgi:LmbE family N-acetylglucosaminyl deacetylase